MYLLTKNLLYGGYGFFRKGGHATPFYFPIFNILNILYGVSFSNKFVPLENDHFALVHCVRSTHLYGILCVPSI